MQHSRHAVSTMRCKALTVCVQLGVYMLAVIIVLFPAMLCQDLWTPTIWIDGCVLILTPSRPCGKKHFMHNPYLTLSIAITIEASGYQIFEYNIQYFNVLHTNMSKKSDIYHRINCPSPSNLLQGRHTTFFRTTASILQSFDTRRVMG